MRYYSRSRKSSEYHRAFLIYIWAAGSMSEVVTTPSVITAGTPNARALGGTVLLLPTSAQAPTSEVGPTTALCKTTAWEPMSEPDSLLYEEPYHEDWGDAAPTRFRVSLQEDSTS